MKYLTALVLMLIMPLSYAKTVAGYDLAHILPKSITAKSPIKIGRLAKFRTRLKWAYNDGSGLVYDILIGEDSPFEFNCIYESNNQLENQSIVFIVIVAFCKSQLSRWANQKSQSIR